MPRSVLSFARIFNVYDRMAPRRAGLAAAGRKQRNAFFPND
jgi:hypothetical protein